MNRSQAAFFVGATVFGLFIGMGLKSTGASKVVETERLVLGGDAPRIEIMSNGKAVTTFSVEKGVAQIAMRDSKGQDRLQIQGGDSPAVYMRNGKGEIVGAMLMLEDGGTAIGLADRDGDIAALLRGGANPGVSLFEKSGEPDIALGISKSVPHLLLTSKKAKDSAIFHGGDTASLLFADQEGNVSLFLSKDGLYQGKKEEKEEPKKPQGKIFTWDPKQNPLKAR